MTKNGEKVCLVVSFYGGERLGDQEILAGKYLAAHKECLSKYKHNLDKIYFVLSKDGETRYLEDPKVKEGISFIVRPNFGLSFGAWADTYDFYKDNFDYFIFCEDDYCFVKDNFDQILVDQYKANKTEYLMNWRESAGRGPWLPEPELISTIGIIDNSFPRFNWREKMRGPERDHHLNMWGHEKGYHMEHFMRQFKTISCLSREYGVFPYWCPHEQEVRKYGWSDEETEEENLNRVFLTCFQYLEELNEKTSS